MTGSVRPITGKFDGEASKKDSLKSTYGLRAVGRR